MGGDTVKLLALDTATEACSAALQWPGGALHRFEVAGRDHTRRLPAMVAALLAEAGLRVSDLDGIACGVGPGSFAGVRIGIGFAKGLALAADLPTVGISSLAMLAEAQDEPSVLTVIDARLSAVYAGAWRRQPQGWTAVLAPMLCLPADLPSCAEAGPGWAGVGTGFGPYAETLVPAWGAPLTRMDARALPDARAALRLAQPLFVAGQGVPADALQPSYLRDKVALTMVEQRAQRAANGD